MTDKETKVTKKIKSKSKVAESVENNNKVFLPRNADYDSMMYASIHLDGIVKGLRIQFFLDTAGLTESYVTSSINDSDFVSYNVEVYEHNPESESPSIIEKTMEQFNLRIKSQK